MGILALVLALIAGGTEEVAVACTPALVSETTIIGLGVSNYAVRTRGSLRRLKGAILDALSQPIEHALVEVYDHPEMNSSYGLVERDGTQTRLAACWTDASGQYRFDRIPPGHYDLRVSATGFNHGFHWVCFNPKWKGRNRLDVHLSVWD